MLAFMSLSHANAEQRVSAACLKACPACRNCFGASRPDLLQRLGVTAIVRNNVMSARLLLMLSPQKSPSTPSADAETWYHSFHHYFVACGPKPIGKGNIIISIIIFMPYLSNGRYHSFYHDFLVDVALGDGIDEGFVS